MFYHLFPDSSKQVLCGELVGPYALGDEEMFPLSKTLFFGRWELLKRKQSNLSWGLCSPRARFLVLRRFQTLQWIGFDKARLPFIFWDLVSQSVRLKTPHRNHREKVNSFLPTTNQSAVFTNVTPTLILRGDNFASFIFLFRSSSQELITTV